MSEKYIDGRPTEPRWLRWGRFLVADLLIWTAFGFLIAIQDHWNASGPGSTPPPMRTILAYDLTKYWLYAVLTPYVFWLASRFSFSRKLTVRAALVFAAGFVVFQGIYVGLRMIFYPPIYSLSAPPQRTLQAAYDLSLSTLFVQGWMYGSILAAALILQYVREVRLRELRESQLKTQVAEYELQILKLQLHPHFLFNTLNGISTLMATDTQTAQEMMVRLSDLLRMALSHSSAREVSLREEVEFIESYLELEQMRFGARLRVRMDIAAETLDARLPNMVLQPLVENAVRHGIAKRREGGEILVESSRRNGNLRVSIANDGPPIESNMPFPSGSGVGLGNTRSRLLQLYPSSTLQVANRPQGGVQVCLEIPFHEATQ